VNHEYYKLILLLHSSSEIQYLDVGIYSSDVSQPISIIFGRNVADRVSYLILPNLCFCTTWGNVNPKIATFLSDTVHCFTNTQKHLKTHADSHVVMPAKNGHNRWTYVRATVSNISVVFWAAVYRQWLYGCIMARSASSFVVIFLFAFLC